MKNNFSPQVAYAFFIMHMFMQVDLEAIHLICSGKYPLWIQTEEPITASCFLRFPQSLQAKPWYYLDVYQRFPNFYTLRPPQDVALIYAPPPEKKTQNIIYGT
jgi:hypothetical protein